MDGFSAGVSGLRATAQAFALTSNNIANLNSNGYRAERLVQQSLPQGGVAAQGVQLSQAPLEPGGSNVDLATEAVQMKTLSVGYQADAAFLKVQEGMLGSALDIDA
jgi:flagellar hook protein FlgE